MSFSYTESSIRAFIRQFEDHTLPKEQWTHEAHLVVAIGYTWHYTLPEALIRVRRGIRSYNDAVGTPNTDSRGYHETLTRFWLEIAARFVQKCQNHSLAEACQLFIQSKEASRNYPLHFYSRELLFSVQARHHWVDPDLCAMPV